MIALIGVVNAGQMFRQNRDGSKIIEGSAEEVDDECSEVNFFLSLPWQH